MGDEVDDIKAAYDKWAADIKQHKQGLGGYASTPDAFAVDSVSSGPPSIKDASAEYMKLHDHGLVSTESLLGEFKSHKYGKWPDKATQKESCKPTHTQLMANIQSGGAELATTKYAAMMTLAENMAALLAADMARRLFVIASTHAAAATGMAGRDECHAAAGDLDDVLSVVAVLSSLAGCSVPPCEDELQANPGWPNSEYTLYREVVVRTHDLRGHHAMLEQIYRISDGATVVELIEQCPGGDAMLTAMPHEDYVARLEKLPLDEPTFDDFRALLPHLAEERCRSLFFDDMGVKRYSIDTLPAKVIGATNVLFWDSVARKLTLNGGEPSEHYIRMRYATWCAEYAGSHWADTLVAAASVAELVVFRLLGCGNTAVIACLNTPISTLLGRLAKEMKWLPTLDEAIVLTTSRTSFAREFARHAKHVLVVDACGVCGGWLAGQKCVLCGTAHAAEMVSPLEAAGATRAKDWEIPLPAVVRQCAEHELGIKFKFTAGAIADMQRHAYVATVGGDVIERMHAAMADHLAAIADASLREMVRAAMPPLVLMLPKKSAANLVRSLEFDDPDDDTPA